MSTPATSPAPAADSKTPAPAAAALTSAETKPAADTKQPVTTEGALKAPLKLPPPLVTSEGASPAGEVKSDKPASSESDFTEWPEGFDDTVKSTLSDFGKELATELKLDGNGKTAAMKSLVKRWATAQADAQKQAEEAFVNQAHAHAKAAESHETVKALGGIDKARGLASEALKKHGSPALNELLNRTGLSYHPEVLAFFAKVGRSFSEDSVAGGSSSAARPLSDGERIKATYDHPTSKSMFQE